MLKYHNYDIVFQEIPDEVTLAVNLTNCPHRCVGCHSPHLREDIGEVLNEKAMDSLLKKYGKQITCVCFMGGDGQAQDVETICSCCLFASIKERNLAYFLLRIEVSEK